MDRLTELRTAIAHNAVAGGSAYGRAAAEVVALSLEGQPDEEVAVVVSRTTEWLISTKPSITSMRTVAFAALEASLSSEDPRGAVLARMRTFIADSERAIASIADHAASMIKPGDKVLYDSYSGSLVQLFLRAVETTPGLTVMLTESRPYRSHNCRIGRAGGPCSVTHEHV
jgi:translation initiation factor 2B subunit (eIF-2B alpha/beta/delta family)